MKVAGEGPPAAAKVGVAPRDAVAAARAKRYPCW